MKAIVLVGGLGTRLLPLTLDHPKGLLPVLNRPFLSYQLDLLRAGGVTDVLFAAGRNTKSWERALRALQLGRLKIHFSYEPAPLGTGGAIRFGAEALRRAGRLDGAPLIVLNGDVFFDFDLRAFVRFHAERGAVGSIALHEVEDSSRFGVVLLNNQNRVTAFIEKPSEPVGSNWINAGAYVFNPGWVLSLPRGKVISIERDAFPDALKRGDPIYGFQMQGYWNDIGTHATYLQAHGDLLIRPNRWYRPAVAGRAQPGGRRSPRFRGHAAVTVGPGTRLGKDVVMDGFVSVGREVRIGDGCVLQNSVILDGARLGERVWVQSAIVGPKAVVGDHAALGPGTVLGRGTVLTSYTRCG